MQELRMDGAVLVIHDEQALRAAARQALLQAPSGVPSHPSIGRMQNRLRGVSPSASMAWARGARSPDST
jgi:hypothetical protein